MPLLLWPQACLYQTILGHENIDWQLLCACEPDLCHWYINVFPLIVAFQNECIIITITTIAS